MGRWDQYFKDLSKKGSLQSKRWFEKHPNYMHNYQRTGASRAYRFLRRNPDCTSTRTEIALIYDASINMLTGEKGEVGPGKYKLCLDHIHGGPAVGLIPNWLNTILWAGMSSPEARQYILARLSNLKGQE
jgi:hypothetical protein